MATILNGKEISAELRGRIAATVESVGIQPGLATVLVGENPASVSYVTSKKQACENAGFKAVDVRLPADITQEALEKELEELNRRSDINGILVQQPLPDHLDTERAVSLVVPEKDVDGFHPVNLGRLMRGLKCFVPCTPFGVVWMLSTAGISTSGKNVVIVGRSLLVGKPLALLLMAKTTDQDKVFRSGNATVTVCHSRTANLEEVTRSADIVVAAMGTPEFIKGSMVGDGAVVIDVGINRVPDASKKSGHRIVGDVAYDEVEPIASAITPVPRGVGPMTVTMLLYNTLQSARGLYSQDPL